MADKEDKPKRLTGEALLRLPADRMAKVRYGRATLTVERTDGVLMTALSDLLAAHRKEEVGTEEVAWAFIKRACSRTLSPFPLGRHRPPKAPSPRHRRDSGTE